MASVVWFPRKWLFWTRSFWWSVKCCPIPKQTKSFSDLHWNHFLYFFLFCRMRTLQHKFCPIPEQINISNWSSVVWIPNEWLLWDNSVSSAQFPVGRSPKTLNGLLSPQCEERVRVSQLSLSDKFQKDRSWVGSLATEGGSASGMDHSAILPLRSKNFREKSDVHFVEVIKGDRWVRED